MRTRFSFTSRTERPLSRMLLYQMRTRPPRREPPSSFAGTPLHDGLNFSFPPRLCQAADTGLNGPARILQLAGAGELVGLDGQGDDAGADLVGAVSLGLGADSATDADDAERSLDDVLRLSAF